MTNKQQNGHPQTIVVKIGSSSVIDENTGKVALTCLSELVEALCKFRKAGHRVVLVSSGAVGIGMLRLNMTVKPTTVQGKQAAAAVGQGRLMKVYDDLFSYFDQPVAQVLLSRGDLAERHRYKNAHDTLEELFANGVIPILNENDTTSVDEIRFGDNDSLSAMVGAILGASWLFLMTDVDALYDANPNTHPDAKPIRVVDDIDSLCKTAQIDGAGSRWGTGGMETKITAARLATASGCHCVIVHSKKPKDMEAIIEGSREVGTVFMPFTRPIHEGKRFISHGANVQGTIYVDDGAVRALVERKSLLPAGITRVEGEFEAQSNPTDIYHTQCGVNVVSPDGRVIAKGLANYCSKEINKIR
eukprot:Ihof_evm11s105 gene=Ihof_evmTU11s105